MMMLRAELKRAGGRRGAALAACALACCLAFSPSARAQTTPDYARVLDLISQQEQRLDAQERQLTEQQRQLAEQRSLIERQRREIQAMSSLSPADLGEVRGAGAPSTALAYTALASDQPISINRRRALRTIDQNEAGGGATAAAAPPAGPVGEAPPEQAPAANVAALPEGSTALQGRGKLTIEPSLEYSRSSSNRLVFRGVEIVTGIQIGLIEASDTARDTISSSLAIRYALTDRLEIEGRVPYVMRNDRITTLSQGGGAQTQTMELNGGDIGDIEASARYQLNTPERGGAIFVAGARIKSTTGRGPFDLARDNQGVSTELATGSGFWGLQGSVSVLYPSDPVVLYANASYLYNMEASINKDVGTVHIGDVDPGDSIGLGFGMGFALNPRFSYSLGYSHSYIMPTETELNATQQRSTELQIGALQFGMSFRATERLTIATSVDVGVTEDAPDVRVALRTPFRF
jgi:hypothetical protein